MVFSNDAALTSSINDALKRNFSYVPLIATQRVTANLIDEGVHFLGCRLGDPLYANTTFVNSSGDVEYRTGSFVSNVAKVILDSDGVHIINNEGKDIEQCGQYLTKLEAERNASITTSKFNIGQEVHYLKLNGDIKSLIDDMITLGHSKITNIHILPDNKVGVQMLRDTVVCNDKDITKWIFMSYDEAVAGAIAMYREIVNKLTADK